MRDASVSDKPLIYLITEGEATDENFIAEKKEILHIIQTAVEIKIPLVQIREKQISAKLLYELVIEVIQIAKNSATKILVNDRADVALAAGVGGVHLTSRSLSAQTIRENFPAQFLIGVSVHSPEKAEQARREGADFVTFGPIFSTPGKGAPKGLEKLREVCDGLRGFPVIALGGIDWANYEAVLSAGAAGLAAIRFLNDAENLRKFSEKFAR